MSERDKGAMGAYRVAFGGKVEKHLDALLWSSVDVHLD